MSGWRVVMVSSRAKLELHLNYLVVKASEFTKRIHIDEINTLILENTGICLSCALLEKLCKSKVNILFCDHKHLPLSQLLPLSGSHDSPSKIESQIRWTDENKGAVWAYIVKAKIKKQAECLFKYDRIQYQKLLEYVDGVKILDLTNREGPAAKIYFNALFGHDFFRTVDSKINSALDYGYSVILSTVAREITANGYITQLGIFHHNTFNAYNLASDLMEPFRPLVDITVAGFSLGELIISIEEKQDLVNILNDKVTINGEKTTVINAIKVYVKSVLDALESGDTEAIKMYSYEF